MNKTEVHPIDLALVAGLVVIEAVVVLVAAVVALLLTAFPKHARFGNAAAPAPAAEPEPIKYPSSTRQVAQPQLHPLALIATQLQALPVATLRQMANTRSKTVRKAQLIEMVAACS